MNYGKDFNMTINCDSQNIHTYSSHHKNIKGLLLVSLTISAKLNFVLFWAKLHLFSKTLEKCKQRYLMNQKFIKGLITYQGK